tara:strand:- start:383 stop:697 length:315 start_codon:yes stop_codon:yes gene_type:complete
MDDEAYRKEKLDDMVRESRMEEWEEERQLSCDHEGAYPQETRVIVWGQLHLGRALKEIREGVFRSTAFTLEVEHYCPKCGKTEWIVCELEDSMFGESDELLGND